MKEWINEWMKEWWMNEIINEWMICILVYGRNYSKLRHIGSIMPISWPLI